MQLLRVPQIAMRSRWRLATDTTRETMHTTKFVIFGKRVVLGLVPAANQVAAPTGANLSSTRPNAFAAVTHTLFLWHSTTTTTTKRNLVLSSLAFKP